LNWLTNAMTYLIRIDESRRVENVYDNAYCIFEVGRIYFQCLAPPFGTYLRCESVSENFVPELAAILTPERKGRLTREFGFTAPGYSKNFSQKIEIKGREDLAYALVPLLSPRDTNGACADAIVFKAATLSLPPRI
jgi:hypothetical protein